MIENAFEQAFFAAEVIMDQSFIGFGNVRDLSDRGGIETHFSEYPVRSLQNPVLSFHSLFPNPAKPEPKRLC